MYHTLEIRREVENSSKLIRLQKNFAGTILYMSNVCKKY